MDDIGLSRTAVMIGSQLPWYNAVLFNHSAPRRCLLLGNFSTLQLKCLVPWGIFSSDQMGHCLFTLRDWRLQFQPPSHRPPRVTSPPHPTSSCSQAQSPLISSSPQFIICLMILKESMILTQLGGGGMRVGGTPSWSSSHFLSCPAWRNEMLINYHWHLGPCTSAHVGDINPSSDQIMSALWSPLRVR